jgi:hypothetical protein
MAQTDPIIARSEAGGKPVVRDGESTRRKRGKPAKTPVEVGRWPKGFGKMAPRLSPRTHLIWGQLNGRGKVYCLLSGDLLVLERTRFGGGNGPGYGDS